MISGIQISYNGRRYSSISDALKDALNDGVNEIIQEHANSIVRAAEKYRPDVEKEGGTMTITVTSEGVEIDMKGLSDELIKKISVAANRQSGR